MPESSETSANIFTAAPSDSRTTVLTAGILYRWRGSGCRDLLKTQRATYWEAHRSCRPFWHFHTVRAYDKPIVYALFESKEVVALGYNNRLSSKRATIVVRVGTICSLPAAMGAVPVVGEEAETNCNRQPVTDLRDQRSFVTRELCNHDY